MGARQLARACRKSCCYPAKAWKADSQDQFTFYAFSSGFGHVLGCVLGVRGGMKGRRGKIFTQHYGHCSHLGETAWRG